MTIPEDITGLLRDEANLSLARAAIDAALKEAVARMALVRQTRPPFGILASKENRGKFELTMQLAMEHEALLRGRLAKVEVLEMWIRSKLRPRLDDFSGQVSPEIRRARDVCHALDQYCTQAGESMQYLQAFARELRGLIKSVSQANGQQAVAHTFADLREAATNFDCHILSLEIAGQSLMRLLDDSIFSEIKIAIPGFVPQMPTIERLPRRDAGAILAYARQTEAHLRSLLTEAMNGLPARIAAAHTQATDIKNKYLEYYWDHLRVHAQTHYVIERDLDEMLAELVHRRLEEHKHERARRDLYAYIK